jgi:pilus assembly protein Flp/PilA
MRRVVQDFARSRPIRSEAGVTAIEYGLIAALVALAIITGITAVGTNLGAFFTTLASKI